MPYLMCQIYEIRSKNAVVINMATKLSYPHAMCAWRKESVPDQGSHMSRIPPAESLSTVPSAGYPTLVGSVTGGDLIHTSEADHAPLSRCASELGPQTRSSHRNWGHASQTPQIEVFRHILTGYLNLSEHFSRQMSATQLRSHRVAL